MPSGCQRRRTASASIPMPIRSSERKSSSACSRVIIAFQEYQTGCARLKGANSSAHGQNFVLQFPDEKINGEERLRFSPAPAVHMPLRTEVFHVPAVGEIQCYLV